MKNRTKVMLAFALVAGVTFFVALVFKAFLIAFATVCLALVVTFIMRIAWMRPRGYPPEHHHESDRILDDARP